MGSTVLLEVAVRALTTTNNKCFLSFMSSLLCSRLNKYKYEYVVYFFLFLLLESIRVGVALKQQKIIEEKNRRVSVAVTENESGAETTHNPKQSKARGSQQAGREVLLEKQRLRGP